MTRRGRMLVALGAAAYACAWAFGSTPLSTVGVGLLASAGLAWASLRAAGRGRLQRELPSERAIEGDDVPIVLEAELRGRLPAASVSVVERFAGVRRELALARRRGRYVGGYVLRGIPRGRYAVDSVQLVLEDAFGLARVERPLAAGGALVVQPRLVELERLFSETARRSWDGRRLLLRRPAGFDLHGIREYERGDSLRAVHWRSTARRGELMVKELEDAPRAEVAVVLDGHGCPAHGRGPETPFDAAVRAAGSILLTHITRGRNARLVLNLAAPETLEVSSGRRWLEALERLAAVEPTGNRRVEWLLRGPQALDVPDVAVVTANLSRGLVEALSGRAASRTAVSLVHVDAASYAPSAGRSVEPALLRLRAAGVPVAVVRRGEDLRAALSAVSLGETASG